MLYSFEKYRIVAKIFQIYFFVFILLVVNPPI